MKPAEFEQTYSAARSAYENDDLKTAQTLYLELIKSCPLQANLAFRLGLIAHQQKKYEHAQKWYQRELESYPSFWGCRANLGRVLIKLKHWHQAFQELRVALNDCPATENNARAEIHLDKALCLRAQAQAEAAKKELQEGLILATEAQLKANLSHELARIYHHQGVFELAQHHFNQAYSFYPSTKTQWEQARSLSDYKHYQEAYPLFLKAAKAQNLTSTQQGHIIGQAANCLMEINQPEKAWSLYNQALQISKCNTLKLSQLSVMPIVYDQQETMQLWRDKFSQHLAHLNLIPFDTDPDVPLNWIGLPFYLPYQGQNDLAELSLLADKVSAALPKVMTGTPNRKAGSLRIGGISHFFHTHSVMNCFADLFISLSTEFELHIISVNPLLQDSITQEMRQAAKSYTELNGSLQNQVETIQALELDILIYSDTLLDPNTYLLSLYRLAAIQVLLPGQPLSSGSANLDYFITDPISETAHAQNFFREKLVYLPSMPNLYRASAMPAKVPLPFSLPQNKVLYLCAGAAYKIHPDMDQCLAQLLYQNKSAILILLASHPPGLMERVAKRIQELLTPEAKDRLIILPRLNHMQFQSLLRQVDLLLETWPFGSFNTLMDAFSLGTPVLTLPGEYLRGRYAQALLHILECHELIAHSIDDYCQIAERITKDKKFAAKIKQKILKLNHLLFSNQDNAINLHRWLREIETGKFR